MNVKPICVNCGHEQYITKSATNQHWNAVTQEWEDSNEPDYNCPHCGDTNVQFVPTDFDAHYDCPDCGGDYGQDIGWRGSVCNLCKRGTVQFSNLPDEQEKHWSAYNATRPAWFVGTELTHDEAVNLSTRIGEHGRIKYTPDGWEAYQ